MSSTPKPPSLLETPGLPRRMASFLYEGVLLFGVVVVAALFYAGLTDQRHALRGQTGLQISLFIVLGIYFVGFWTRGGQTLAMKTWHIRVVTREGSTLSWQRALARYLAAWMWFLPALVSVHRAQLKSAWPAFAALLVGALVYALLTRLHPDRQFLHDALCGTRLVTWRPLRPAKSAG
jgi:uncharacterized RDD family membrane protein YckC